MHNVYIQLVGGIGNQLFQVAAAYAYARTHHKFLVIDQSKWVAGQGKNPDTYKNNLFKNFKYSNYHAGEVTHIHEKRFNYDPLPYHDGHVCLHGYFQSIKYFEPYIEELKEIINLDGYGCVDYSWLERPKNVAVHIRRGDYMNLKHIHLVCGTEYFTNNIKKFPNHQINVFTDSIDYVKQEFSDLDINIIDTKSEIQDFQLMSIHDNMICSNSSFSWWASFLNNKKQQIIVPDRWFNNFEPHEDIYRDEFTITEA